MGLGGFQFGDRRYQELTTRPHRSEQEFNQEKGATERQKYETDCFQLRFWIPSGYLGGGIFHQNVAKQNKLQFCFAPWESWRMLCGSLAQVEVEIRGQVGAAGIWEYGNLQTIAQVRDGGDPRCCVCQQDVTLSFKVNKECCDRSRILTRPLSLSGCLG